MGKRMPFQGSVKGKQIVGDTLKEADWRKILPRIGDVGELSKLFRS
jgi:hypothetical protein